jgi:large subunit ribosomal protein L21
MYAIIETGGKQYRVSPGLTLEVEKLAGDVGAAVQFEKVLALSPEDGRILVGGDAASAKVKATITAQGRGDKIIVFKFKRKKQYKKTQGHRQSLTTVKIDDIVA